MLLVTHGGAGIAQLRLFVAAGCPRHGTLPFGHGLSHQLPFFKSIRLAVWYGNDVVQG